MSKTAKWVLGLALIFVLVFGLFLIVLFNWFLSGEVDESSSISGEKLAVIELQEPILNSEEVVRQFKKYRDNRSVKAIVFRVDSPGGGVAASQEIYEEVKKTRESGKPVVVSMGSIAASGGYYVSCAANTIVANPGTLTGSIGVIFQFLHFDQLMKKIGVDASTYKTGRFKDIGSPFRRPSGDEKAFFDQLLADVYDQFVTTVAEERKLARRKVLQYADGRIFTGRQAYEYGFVDTLGTFEDAVAIAAALGGIEGKPRVVKERKRKGFWRELFGEAASELRSMRAEFLDQPIVQYRFVAPQ
ncbi:MAG TPA: signal peptide peptidase SppA [Bacteroidota bacterium]|nr:signal peptide peptidase SppA [Bacteroidota bacterium]